MIQISKQERKDLESVGLLKYGKGGRNPEDRNFTITNRQGRSGAKTIYVTESFEILTFLERFDDRNLSNLRDINGVGLMLIWPNQLQRLKDSGVIEENQIQTHGVFNPKALAYVDRNGQCRVKKTYEILTALGRNVKKTIKPRTEESNYN